MAGADDEPPELGWWTSLRVALADVASRREWTIGANDGIIATAGLLQGFAGAGASQRLLVFTATAATIAGGLSVGGAAWAEDAAEREAQLLAVAQEQHDLSVDRDAELDELAAYWERRGLEPRLAGEVADALMTHDALGAQLAWEHGFEEPMPRMVPVWSGVATAVTYVIGALIPVLITYFAPVEIETWAILAAVVVALTITSVAASRAVPLSARRMLVRSLFVGGATMLVSYLAGEALL